MSKELTTPCYGRSQKSGKPVGSRHRWNGGVSCEWCGRYKDDIFVTIKSNKTSDDDTQMKDKQDD